jgi:hypothetical protein
MCTQNLHHIHSFTPFPTTPTHWYQCPQGGPAPPSCSLTL